MNPATRVDGLIVSNTTLVSHAEAAACGAVPVNPDVAPSDVVWGGLSGRPLRQKSTACLARVSVLTRRRD
ncbi:hypothetical protein AHF37_02057 [Paragonimus kellicotti]|nr:hypothetical protein AHF37_02057 [Paragonimus kellicotti]